MYDKNLVYNSEFHGNLKDKEKFINKNKNQSGVILNQINPYR